MDAAGASVYLIGRKLGIDPRQVRGAIYLLKRCQPTPSPERLALVAMSDQGLDDHDIAEMWQQTVGWAAAVRKYAKQIREAEPIKKYLEEMGGWHDPTDPSPEAIRAECQRFLRERPRDKVGPGVRCMEVSYDGRCQAFVPLGPSPGT